MGANAGAERDAWFQGVLSAARAGDEAAFTTLFRSVQPFLLRYLRASIGSDAEDVAGETWVQVVRGLQRFSGGESGFRGWVFTIAHGRAVDLWRARGRRPETLSDRLPEVADTYDVETSVEEIFSTEAALALIRRLPPTQAQVLLLRVVGGLDVGTTATILGRTPNHVRVLSHRGLRTLATFLGTQGSLLL